MSQTPQEFMESLVRSEEARITVRRVRRGEWYVSVFEPEALPVNAAGPSLREALINARNAIEERPQSCK